VLADKRRHLRAGKHACRLPGEFFAHEPAVMTDNNALISAFVGVQKICDRLSDNTDIFEGKILGENAAPTGCSELYLSHFSLLHKG
jgi:hypothetical protein